MAKQRRFKRTKPKEPKLSRRTKPGGMSLLQQVVGAAQGQSAEGESKSEYVAKDEKTGESYLRLPMPKPEVLDEVLQTVGSLLKRLRQ